MDTAQSFDPETGEIHRDIPTPARAPVSPFASNPGGEISDALAAAQGAFETPKRSREVSVRLSSGGSYSFKYAPLEAIHDAIRPALAQNGLSVQQYLAYRAGEPFIRTIIWHASGEWRGSDYPVFATKEGPQGFASGVTYARRYGLCLALSLAPEDDDDGNAAEGNVAQPTGGRIPIRGRRPPSGQSEEAPPPPPERVRAPAPWEMIGDPVTDVAPEPEPEVFDKAAAKKQASQQLTNLREAIGQADAQGLDAILDSQDIKDTFALVRKAADTGAAAEATINRLMDIANRRRRELVGEPAELQL